MPAKARRAMGGGSKGWEGGRGGGDAKRRTRILPRTPSSCVSTSIVALSVSYPPLAATPPQNVPTPARTHTQQRSFSSAAASSRDHRAREGGWEGGREGGKGRTISSRTSPAEKAWPSWTFQAAMPPSVIVGDLGGDGVRPGTGGGRTQARRGRIEGGGQRSGQGEETSGGDGRWAWAG